MQTGIIKTVKDAGFGFIEIKGEADLFFHASTLQGLEFGPQLVGQRVEVESEFDNRRGKTRASGVWPASN